VRLNLFRITRLNALTLIAMTLILANGVWAQPKFKILHAVPGGLFGGLTLDAKGNLYGVTGAGGDDNQGTIFELTPGAHGWTLHTLHSFDGQNGGSPNGGLIFDAGGNFYGTALGGPGLQDGGVVYEMMRKTDGWTFNVLYDFCLQYHCPDGGGPQSGVVLDNAGNLYGSTGGGGEYGGGTVFELTPDSGGWEESLLYSFCSKPYCADGQTPIAGLIFDQAGGLYGTTFRGGAYGEGSVFRLKRAPGGAWDERVLYSFCSAGFPLCKDGQRAYAGVVFDGSGDIYGTTEQGGGNTCGETTCGTVYKLTPTRSGGWRHTVLYAFPNPADGSFPTGGVVIDKAGNLYGATVAGGIGGCSGGCGVAYKLSPSTGAKWTYNVLHKFDGADGAQPLGGFIFDGKGNLYGTAYSVVFKITP
jgi:uncharacterized repeat protein (TIGR03803 family)